MIASIAAMVLRPTVVSFLDVMMQDEETAFRLDEIAVPEGSSFHGRALKEVEIPQPGQIVAGLGLLGYKCNLCDEEI